MPGRRGARSLVSTTGPGPVVLALDVAAPERRLIETAFAEAEARRTGLVIEYAEPQPERVQAAEIALHEMLAGDRADHPDLTVEIRVTPGRAG